MHIRDWSSDVCCSYLYIARPARRSVRLGRAAGFARGATRTGVDAAFRIKAAATGDAADGITADRAKTAATRTAQRSAERAAKAATAAPQLSRGPRRAGPGRQPDRQQASTRPPGRRAEPPSGTAPSRE